MKIGDLFLQIVTLISPTLNTKILYRRRLKERINLKNPKKFNEKIQWLKLNVYPKNEIYARCADKYLVREYIKECGCEEILNKLYGVYDSTKQIEWNKLPNQFVLKWNFGCGLNIICSDKTKLDEKDVKQKLKRWKHSKFYLKTSEMHYSKIKRKIVCEEYLSNDNGTGLDDYKIYCFNGRADSIMVCVGRSEGKPKFYYFDREWNWLKDYSYDGINSKSEINIEKPKCFDDMIKYAEILSKPFPFVRVDLYVANNKVYFGELTFTPAAGLDAEKTLIADESQASKIKIKK